MINARLVGAKGKSVFVVNHEVDGGIGYGCEVFIDLYHFGIQQGLCGICIEYALDHRSGSGVVLNWYQNLSAATGKTQDRKTKNQCVDDVGYT